eukprot:518712_1
MTLISICLLILFRVHKCIKITMKEVEQGVSESQIKPNSGNPIPPTAKTIYQEAIQKRSNGKYKEARDELLFAHNIVPQWEYPLYELAYTYLLQKDYKNALIYYKKTNSLFPSGHGFLNTQTAIWSLRNEKKNNKFKKGLYYDYVMIETLDKSEQLHAYQQIINTYPYYAPAYNKIALIGNDMETKQNAIDDGLALIDTEFGVDKETGGMLYIQQALMYWENSDFDSAKRVLAELIMGDNVTFHNENMAKWIMKTINEMYRSECDRDKQEL